MPGGAAERAGLHGPQVRIEEKRQGPFIIKRENVDIAAADLIVAADSQPIKTADDFLSIVEAKQPGDEVIVTVFRGGRQTQIPLRLETSK